MFYNPLCLIVLYCRLSFIFSCFMKELRIFFSHLWRWKYLNLIEYVDCFSCVKSIEIFWIFLFLVENNFHTLIDETITIIYFISFSLKIVLYSRQYCMLYNSYMCCTIAVLWLFKKQSAKLYFVDLQACRKLYLYPELFKMTRCQTYVK